VEETDSTTSILPPQMLQLWFLLFELARAPTSVFDFFFSPAMLLPPFCVHFFSGMIAFIF
jgi:hypothetical protein